MCVFSVSCSEKGHLWCNHSTTPACTLFQIPASFHVATRLELIRGYPAPGLFQKEVFEFPLPQTHHTFNYINSTGFQYQAEAVRQAILEGEYCIRGYFRGGFIFANFVSQSQKFPLQYMPIYSNENITKITKLSHRKFSHLVQNRENIWCLQYLFCHGKETNQQMYYRCRFRYRCRLSVTRFSRHSKHIG